MKGAFDAVPDALAPNGSVFNFRDFAGRKPGFPFFTAGISLSSKQKVFAFDNGSPPPPRRKIARFAAERFDGLTIQGGSDFRAKERRVPISTVASSVGRVALDEFGFSPGFFPSPA